MVQSSWLLEIELVPKMFVNLISQSCSPSPGLAGASRSSCAHSFSSRSHRHGEGLGPAGASWGRQGRRRLPKAAYFSHETVFSSREVLCWKILSPLWMLRVANPNTLNSGTFEFYSFQYGALFIKLKEKYFAVKANFLF